MRKLVYSLFLTLFIGLYMQGQTPIHIQKIEVVDSVRIAITWTAVWSANTEACELWRASRTSSTYHKIAEFTRSKDSVYVDSNLQTKSESYSYFIQLRNRNGIYTSMSDTLHSLVLFGFSKNKQGVSDGIAYLNWNHPQQTSDILNLKAAFLVQRAKENVWIPINTLKSLAYNDSIYACDSSFSYRIVFMTPLEEVISNVITLHIQDLQEPQAVIFDSISVNNNNQQIILGWQASESKDVKAYIVLKMIDISLHPLDTVWGRWNTSYSDPQSQAKKAEQYRVQALDACFNGSLFIQKRSVCVSNVSFPLCGDSLHIQWSGPHNMLDNIAYFEIFHAFENMPFEKIINISNPLAKCNYPRFKQNGWHKFMLRAWNNSQMSSTALTDSLYVEEAFLARNLYLRKATQIGDGEVLLSIYLDTISTFKSILVYRQESENAKKKLIKEIASIENEQNYTYIDKTANANLGERYYQLVLMDTCARISLQTVPCATLYLQKEMLSAQQMRLFWNAYQGWDGVFEYVVYRKNTQNMQVEERRRLPSVQGFDEYEYMESWTAEDDLSQWCYYVEAIEHSPSALGDAFQDTVKSNEIGFLNEGNPIFYMPTAFNPKGMTSYYKPIGIFLASDQIRFRVFNRWGKMIFETNSLEPGWDGKYKGAYVHSGVYVYNVQVIRNGQETSMAGTITVL
ncbi:MAG: gliding motility-associated C-terminal domain-containing protein [Bacteroidales bacterium]